LEKKGNNFIVMVIFIEKAIRVRWVCPPLELPSGWLWQFILPVSFQISLNVRTASRKTKRPKDSPCATSHYSYSCHSSSFVEFVVTFLTVLSVSAFIRKQGIGSKLLEAIERYGGKATKFELFTGSRSEGNIRFYQRRGYAVTRTAILSPGVSITYMEKQNVPSLF